MHKIKVAPRAMERSMYGIFPHGPGTNRRNSTKNDDVVIVQGCGEYGPDIWIDEKADDRPKYLFTKW